MKKVIFVNKPEIDNNGQFNFSNEQVTPFNYTASNSLPLRYDKFSDKELYTTTTGHDINNAIIDGGLQFDRASYIKINNLYVNARGMTDDVKDAYVSIFLCDDVHPIWETYGGTR